MSGRTTEIPEAHRAGHARLRLALEDFVRVADDVLPRHPDDARAARAVTHLRDSLGARIDEIFADLCVPPAPPAAPEPPVPRPRRHPNHRRVDEHEG